MKKYTIRIERKETYIFDVNVVSHSIADAIRKVTEDYVSCEYSGERDLFYSPVDVDDGIYCTKEETCS